LPRTGWLADGTMVVCTSDQGFCLGDHGLYDKRFMYEESIRMPLLVRWPGKAKESTRVDRIVLNVDFAPTLLSVAGVAPPKIVQGRSFLPLLRGEQPDDRRQTMYYRFYEQAYGIGPHEGVRTHRYKLVHYPYGDNAWELYDLAKDPRELQNVFDDSNYAKVAGELVRLDLPDNLEGMSLTPLLVNPNQPWKKAVFMVDGDGGQMVRTQKSSYLALKKGPISAAMVCNFVTTSAFASATLLFSPMSARRS
jgi:arylsulfatase A-like enzyme